MTESDDDIVGRMNLEDHNRALLEENKRLKDESERLHDALQKIKQWSEAYPESVFPEPDFAAVRAALEAAGLTLDAVSASNMRHVVRGVGDIARAALQEPRS